jgi:hypothetical protein
VEFGHNFARRGSFVPMASLVSTGVFALLFVALRAEDGCMTKWDDSPNIAENGHCGYAASQYGGMSFKAAQSTYLQSTPRMYCAIHNDHFAGGAACGKCFKLKYDGLGFGSCSATSDNPAPNSGEGIIQVVDSGSGNHDFDCTLETFQFLTGWHTDRFPISYEEVDCETRSCSTSDPDCVLTVAPAPDAPIIDPTSGYLGSTRVIFHNLKTSVSTASAKIGRCPAKTMNRNGALFDWFTSSSGCYKPVCFTATLADSSTVTIDATDWPEYSSMKWCDEVSWHPEGCDAVRKGCDGDVSPVPNPTPQPTPQPTPIANPSEVACCWGNDQTIWSCAAVGSWCSSSEVNCANCQGFLTTRRPARRLPYI